MYRPSHHTVLLSWCVNLKCFQPKLPWIHRLYCKTLSGVYELDEQDKWSRDWMLFVNFFYILLTMLCLNLLLVIFLIYLFIFCLFWWVLFHPLFCFELHLGSTLMYTLFANDGLLAIVMTLRVSRKRKISFSLINPLLTLMEI